MKLPNDLTAYAVDGLLPRLLTPADVPAMLALQAEVLEALPDKRWYYPSDDEEFRQVVSACEGVAYFDGDTLLGFAELTPGELRGSHSYAASLKQPVNGSFDFHDVIVRRPGAGACIPRFSVCFGIWRRTQAAMPSMPRWTRRTGLPGATLSGQAISAWWKSPPTMVGRAGFTGCCFHRRKKSELDFSNRRIHP